MLTYRICSDCSIHLSGETFKEFAKTMRSIFDLAWKGAAQTPSGDSVGTRALPGGGGG